MLKKILLTALIAVLIFSAVGMLAQDENPIRWTMKPEGAVRAIKAGETFNVVVEARISEGWHLYALTQRPDSPVIATRISVPEGQAFKQGGGIKSQAPEVAMDENFGVETEFYKGSATFIVPITVLPTVQGGEQTLKVNAYYQTCNDRFCLPPRTAKVELAVEIKPGGAAGAASEAAKPPEAETKAAPAPAVAASTATSASSTPSNPGTSIPPTSTVANPFAVPVSGSTSNPSPASTNPVDGQSLITFLWLAMGFGALSLLTPCVFPMIPITVSYFTNHAAEDRGAALRKAMVYGVGIILTFTALGMILALAVGAGGVNLLAANPWVNLLITAIFVGFAMNLFGAFQIQIPSRVLTRLDKATNRAGGSEVIGTLLMGFTFTLTSFTCTAPFVGTLLVMAAQGRWQWPLVGMLAFSFVFALPFFFLAWMPQYLARLPKSGGWLNSVKVVMGFLEVAAAMKFLSNADLVWQWNIFTREVCLAVWVAIGVLTTLYLLGQFKLTHDSPVERLGALRLIWTMITLAMTFYLLTGLFGRQLREIESFLPPETGNGSQANGTSRDATGELSWILNDYEGALKKAKQEQKRVFIDFTGYTCTNCRWMEANMFPRAEVQRELEKYVRVRLYTDGNAEFYQRQQKMQQQMFGTVALPYYAVVSADGEKIVTYPGLTRNVAEFVRFLQDGQKPLKGKTAI
jgi:thiol:disulfide interchange protein